MSSAHLEVWQSGRSQLVALEGDRVTLGRGAENTVIIEDDAVSRLHAVFERFPSGWIVRDLGSRNGMFVNGARVAADRALRTGDEIRVGSTRLVFRSSDSNADRTTSLVVAEAPHLTRREHEVLVALCRPLLDNRGLFAEPATVRQVAAELFVTDAAIKQHMVNLYDKFDLSTAEERRRTRLANDAISRGAVTVAHMRKDT